MSLTEQDYHCYSPLPIKKESIRIPLDSDSIPLIHWAKLEIDIQSKEQFTRE